jgi:hypothetical protein
MFIGYTGIWATDYYGFKKGILEKVSERIKGGAYLRIDGCAMKIGKHFKKEILFFLQF